jgi:glycine cleavage system pyridoxal-binding protein P
MTRITTSKAALAAMVAMAGVLSGCAAVQHLAGSARPSAQDLPGQVEPVHAAAIARNEAVFWVTSNGCTAKEDITPVVRETSEGPIITLRRIKEDRCRETLPEGTELRWSFEELGLAPGARLSVENPYQLPPA